MDTTKTLPQQSKAEIKYIEFEETNIDLVKKKTKKNISPHNQGR